MIIITQYVLNEPGEDFYQVETATVCRMRQNRGSFVSSLPPNTSTLNAPSATKIYNIIGRSMEQLVVKF